MYRQKYRLVALIIVCITTPVRGIDLPTWYRGSIFQGLPRTDIRDWTAQLEVQYSQGTSGGSRNDRERQTNLLNVHGAFDFTRLGFNLDGLTAVSKPKTWQHLRNVNSDEADNPPFVGFGTQDLGEFAEFASNDECTLPHTGIFGVDGKLLTSQIDFVYTQNLFSGFYAQLYVPIRRVRLSDITLKHLGTPPTFEERPAFDAFLDLLGIISPAISEVLLPFQNEKIFRKFSLSSSAIANRSVLLLSRVSSSSSIQLQLYSGNIWPV